MCAQVGQQKWGVNYWETHAPVVNWDSVRLLLALCHIHGLDSKSIEIFQLFIQAALKTPAHIEILYGFEKFYDGNLCVLRLRRSTYGLKQSNYNFDQKLCKSLKERNLQLFLSDNYVFVSKRLIILVYLDDALLFSKNKFWVDVFIKSLYDSRAGLELTYEGSADKYLGIDTKSAKL